MSVKCDLEFGSEALRLALPEGTELLSLPPDPPLPDPAAAVRESLVRPVGSPPLAQLVREKRALNPELKAAVVVSDNTRPVPYRGEEGILEPILGVLRAEGVGDIEILVATGTHRPLADAELRGLLPAAAFTEGITVTNHDCTDAGSLRKVGRTARGTEAWINRRYLEADLKILTGLVEPHFMAGASGGAKSVCPGLVGERVTYVFHGTELLADERAASLVIKGNPCQEEARAVAAMAGVDFIVNVTLNAGKRVTGVYSGEVRAAHDAAAARLLETAAVPIEREYDMAVTHAGFTGINHYQAAKAAVEAARAVRAGGAMILAADHTDVDPVGGPNYRRVLAMLTELGVEAFLERILSPDWEFVPEQWEPQMWARALGKLASMKALTYCSPQLTGENFREAAIPGTDGGQGITGLAGRELAEAMVQGAIDGYVKADPDAKIAVLLDGPYGVPVPREVKERM